MLRRLALTLSAGLMVAPVPAARAQGLAVGGIGYLMLSGAAIARLASGADARVGSRVRFNDRDGAPAEGIIAAIDRDSLTVKLSDTEERRLSRTLDMRVSAGMQSRWAEGWALGLGIGAGIGAIGGLTSGDDPPGWMAFTAGEKALLLGVAGGLAGSLLGAVIGAGSESEHWRHVSGFASNVSVAPIPGQGVAVAMRLRF